MLVKLELELRKKGVYEASTVGRMVVIAADEVAVAAAAAAAAGGVVLARTPSWQKQA